MRSDMGVDTVAALVSERGGMERESVSAFGLEDDDLSLGADCVVVNADFFDGGLALFAPGTEIVDRLKPTDLPLLIASHSATNKVRQGLTVSISI